MSQQIEKSQPQKPFWKPLEGLMLSQVVRKEILPHSCPPYTAPFIWLDSLLTIPTSPLFPPTYQTLLLTSCSTETGLIFPFTRDIFILLRPQLNAHPSKWDDILDLWGTSVGRGAGTWPGAGQIVGCECCTGHTGSPQTRGRLTLDALAFFLPLGILVKLCPYCVNLFTFRGPGRRNFCWWNGTAAIDGNSQTLLLGDFLN